MRSKETYKRELDDCHDGGESIPAWSKEKISLKGVFDDPFRLLYDVIF